MAIETTEHLGTLATVMPKMFQIVRTFHGVGPRSRNPLPKQRKCFELDMKTSFSFKLPSDQSSDSLNIYLVPKLPSLLAGASRGSIIQPPRDS